MSLGDLAAQRQPDSGACRFCGEERHKEIRGIHNPGTVVVNKDLDHIFVLTPPDDNFAVGFKSGVNSVVYKID